MPSFVTVDGTKLAFQGEGEGAPVIFLHGFTSSTNGNWQQPSIWDAVRDRGARVIGLDARGHGDSDKPHEPRAYENDAMVQDVVVRLEQERVRFSLVRQALQSWRDGRCSSTESP